MAFYLERPNGMVILMRNEDWSVCRDRDDRRHRRRPTGTDDPVMSGHDIGSVLESFERERDATGDPVRESDTETALVVSCSMSKCEHGEALRPIEPAWNVVTVPTLGNQTWERYDGERVLDGSLAHFTTEYDVTAALVVGHTTCAVVGDAYEQFLAPATGPPAVQSRVDTLVSTVESASEACLVDQSTPPRTAQRRLVEYNVVRQAAFLERTLPDAVTTAGYVCDQGGASRSFADEHHLVALDGKSDPGEIRARLADESPVQVESPL